ncbi:hypothetical protein EV126DRAFT_183121 [Verticillium dahliae]|nr:hypothetical protein EV126DRAFT_183121 [Verticillium dahliae]
MFPYCWAAHTGGPLAPTYSRQYCLPDCCPVPELGLEVVRVLVLVRWVGFWGKKRQGPSCQGLVAQSGSVSSSRGSQGAACPCLSLWLSPVASRLWPLRYPDPRYPVIQVSRYGVPGRQPSRVCASASASSKVTKPCTYIQPCLFPSIKPSSALTTAAFHLVQQYSPYDTRPNDLGRQKHDSTIPHFSSALFQLLGKLARSPQAFPSPPIT